MANASKKIQEGLGHIKEAEKYLKTSFFKWSPDYDSAADRYQKAATCFKVARSYDKAKDAFIKTAECHEKNNQLFHAAKSLTEAGNISIESKIFDEALKLMDKASVLYRENGTPDTACISLVTTAKKIEFTEPLKAMELYEKAAVIAEDGDNIREAAGHLNNASRLLVKSKQYRKAVDIVKRQIELYTKVDNYPSIFNLVLGLVLLYLTEKNLVAAENCYQNSFEYQGFGASDSAEAIEQLIEAYTNGDDAAMKTITSKPIISCQDTEFAKLGKMLRAPKADDGFDEYAGNIGEGETRHPGKGALKSEIDDGEIDLC